MREDIDDMKIQFSHLIDQETQIEEYQSQVEKLQTIFQYIFERYP